MIHRRTKEELDIMRKGGHMLAETLWEVVDLIKPGVSELDLDRLAESLIRKKGGESAFKRVSGYRHTICVSTNDVVVHGIPTDYTFRDGDVVGVDCGVFYKGFNTDMAETIQVKSLPAGQSGQKSKVKGDIDRFLETGKKALDEAIKVAKGGNRVGHISKVIQDIVEKEGGYSIVRTLVGHGVGKKLHEEPEIPGFLNMPIEKTPQLSAGMTIAIEVIYNMGGDEVEYKGTDGWTIATADGSLSGVFERSIAITEKDPIVLTN